MSGRLPHTQCESMAVAQPSRDDDAATDETDKVTRTVANPQRATPASEAGTCSPMSQGGTHSTPRQRRKPARAERVGASNRRVRAAEDVQQQTARCDLRESRVVRLALSRRGGGCAVAHHAAVSRAVTRRWHGGVAPPLSTNKRAGLSASASVSALAGSPSRWRPWPGVDVDGGTARRALPPTVGSPYLGCLCVHVRCLPAHEGRRRRGGGRRRSAPTRDSRRHRGAASRNRRPQRNRDAARGETARATAPSCHVTTTCAHARLLCSEEDQAVVTPSRNASVRERLGG